jgi:hypothetical protein
MRIVSILTCHNERELLPFQLAYLRSQEVEPFVIDNESTDGSVEWLRENDVPFMELQTGGAFALDELQRARIAVASSIAPDWIIYGDMDELNLFEEGIREAISRAAQAGCDAIRLRSYDVCNTGEPPSEAFPIDAYFFGQERYGRRGGIMRMHRYVSGTRYSGDSIRIPGMSVRMDESGCNLNYGNTKPQWKRDALLRRREVAWKRGLAKGAGRHYVSGSMRQWLWDQCELIDLRETQYWPLIMKTSHQIVSSLHSFRGHARKL